MTLKPDFFVLKTLTKLPGIAGRESAVRDYLLHSVSATNAQILPDLIDAIRADGFEFN